MVLENMLPAHLGVAVHEGVEHHEGEGELRLGVALPGGAAARAPVRHLSTANIFTRTKYFLLLRHRVLADPELALLRDPRELLPRLGPALLAAPAAGPRPRLRLPPLRPRLH